MPEHWATPEGRGPWQHPWPPPDPAATEITSSGHLLHGGCWCGEYHVSEVSIRTGRVECGAWSAVVYMLIGALALAAGLLLGLFVFLRVF
jgi:hypothetical protein